MKWRRYADNSVRENRYVSHDQYISIAFLVTAATGRSHDATIQIEVEAVDCVTGERMAASVRKSVGAKLESKNAQLTLKDVQPLLDVWISTGTTFIASKMKRPLPPGSCIEDNLLHAPDGMTRLPLPGPTFPYSVVHKQ